MGVDVNFVDVSGLGKISPTDTWDLLSLTYRSC